MVSELSSAPALTSCVCSSCAVKGAWDIAPLVPFPREVVEAALGHVIQNKVEAADARSDLFERRRRLMADWSAYLD